MTAGLPWRNAGIAAALGAAVLFGAGTPFAKLLLGSLNTWLLAGLLYLGSGLGLSLLRLARRTAPVRLGRREWCWLAGAILAGGVLGPVLLMYGLSAMPASGAALLLNAEGVFTALLAWFAFRENVDRRIALGMAAIVVGALVLAWPGEARFGAAWPALATLMAAGGVGWISYGVSLALFVIALRHLGTARTGAYFSVAPFVGALIALPLLGEPVTLRLLLAGGLMALGVWLHLTERHQHDHLHEAQEHEHEHTHDAHHQHDHDLPVAPDVRHSHRHRHDALTHWHAHFPDAHHRHHH